jgi:ubiquinone/menaquinone biosynthesis C-methylase UbiE
VTIPVLPGCTDPTGKPILGLISVREHTDDEGQAGMSFATKDHFSGHADRYEAFRPTYPDALFAHLASLCPRHEVAWDCATGNGQAAVALAPYFRLVLASDASRQQVSQAKERDAIDYFVAVAERAPIQTASVDIVTVALALHWLDLRRFYAEVRRVCRPEGLVAVWCYELATISPEVDRAVRHLYTDIVGADWPPERRLVEEGYRTLPFPFDEIALPPFPMTHAWNFDHLLGYLGTWSSYQRYRRRTGQDPLDLVRDDLLSAWGDPDQFHQVVFPLHVRAGRVAPHA